MTTDLEPADAPPAWSTCLALARPYDREVPESPLSDLLHGAQDGDQSSWDEIVRRYERLVWRVARDQGLDHELARDVAQATWLRLAENIGAIREAHALGGWLATTARREAWRQSGKARRELPEEPTVLADRVDIGADVDLEAAMVADERAQALWRGLRALDPRCQRLLRLLLDGVPFGSIAETMGHPIGWVGPTRKRCLDKLANTTDVVRLRHG